VGQGNLQKKQKMLWGVILMTESLAHDSTGLRVRLESGKLGFAYESPEPDGLPFPAKSLAPLIHLAIIIF
jgi:hypothetical protein